MNKMYKYVTAIVLMIVSINSAWAIDKGTPYRDLMSLVQKTSVLVQEDAQQAFKNINESGLTIPYVFVLDTNLVVVAHAASPETVGMNRTGVNDSNGKDYTNVMLTKALTSGSGWVDYMHVNPSTGKDTNKLSYIEMVTGSDGKGYIVGSGLYTE